MDLAQVALTTRPSQLRSTSAPAPRRSLPALVTLALVEAKLADIDLNWGPAGSVGFELASGDEVVTESSDLDLAFFVPHRIERSFALEVWNALNSLSAKVDARVETSHCGFSLEEYALQRSGRILVRTPGGSELVEDPWLIHNKGEAR